MAIQKISNVRIAGISAAVPRNCVENKNSGFFSSQDEYERFVSNVGIERRHVGTNGTTCADLCQAATEQLLSKLNWQPNEIDLMIFVSQSADYILPATACVLHGKLGLPQTCCCLDISLGCSGWVYGLATAAAMVSNGGFRKALLLVGDARNHLKGNNATDKSHGPLFGDCGTATALEYDTSASSITIDTRTDGSNAEAIIIRGGAARHPFNEESLIYKPDQFGNIHREIDTEMDGAAVFVFGITKVPRAIKDVLKLTDKTIDEIDFFIFHQANMMMNEQIRRKCKIPAEKCPYSLKDFGNNSSASIPLTIVTQLQQKLDEVEKEIIACGFGVGLSWATMHTKINNTVILPLIQI